MTKLKVKIQKLEEGIEIEVGERKEFLSDIAGSSCFSTLCREDDMIIEREYLVTTELNNNKNKYLSVYAIRSIRKKDREYKKLNKRLMGYERSL